MRWIEATAGDVTQLKENRTRGGGGCPGVNVYVGPDLQAGRAAVGDPLTCLDSAASMNPLQAKIYNCRIQRREEGLQPSLYLKTANGAEIILSLSTPIPVKEKLGEIPSLVGDLARGGAGLHLLTDVGHGLEWSPIVEIRDMGLQPVVRISVGGKNFKAGLVPRKYIYSHNDFAFEVKD